MENKDFFKEDASLPAQYWKAFARTQELGPEKRLLAAVLEDAVKSYRTLAFAGGRRFLEVEAWIFGDDHKNPFSFRNICDVLGLSASRLRQSLRACTTTGLANRRAEKLPPSPCHSTDQGAKKDSVARKILREEPARFPTAP